MNRSTPLVLVADDEVNTTIMLQRIFEREGYAVERVHDGAAALSSAQTLLPDLILLDVQMPHMDGFEVLHRLRSNPNTASIPTIIVTAKAYQPSDAAYGLNIGADDYIRKPFDPSELLARSQSKIRARQLEEALHRRTQELEALLRIGEELNHHVEVDAILSLVPYLALDLVMGDVAVICQCNESREITSCHFQARSTETYSLSDEAYKSLRMYALNPSPLIWPSSHPLLGDLYSGIAVPLENGSEVIGLIVVATNTHIYDTNHLRLLTGISRQASLSLRNAQLYEIQGEYALHLENMIEEKTKDLRSAQQLLVRAEKLASIGHLAASIAHEINNPLQPIRINLEHMLEDIENGSPIDIRGIQSTQENVERIRRIVKQLLEFTGRRETASSDMQALNLKPIIESVVSLNRKLFDQSGLALHLNIEPDLRVYGNKDQLEQVVMNLILNAHDAMKRGNEMQIGGQRINNEVILTFGDQGSGIPQDVIDKVFDPFFSTKPNGTGLGLFVTFGIIQNHQGTIDVQSEVGKGTTFTIKLPAHR
jgi:signal transduction histidine kinase/FixJ family two-component response regulator